MDRGGLPPEFPRAVEKKDPLSYIFLGLCLLALGLTSLLMEMGFLGGLEALSYALLSIGFLLVLDALVRYLKPWTRHKTLPLALTGLLAISLGSSLALGIEVWWPLPLITLGCCSLAYGLLRSKTG